jgi:hypothetical protein
VQLAVEGARKQDPFAIVDAAQDPCASCNSQYMVASQASDAVLALVNLNATILKIAQHGARALPLGVCQQPIMQGPAGQLMSRQ